jgi:heat-inducible transcriptional repressor
MELSDRDRRVLESLVRCYIDTGEAVSSLWLAARGRFGVSSATVRNILGRLEEAGYVRQPHTSAGRVPTDRGYRVHVDQLLSSYRPAVATSPDIEAAIRRATTLDEALAGVTGELSRVSHHVAFVLGPAPETATLKHIDFVPLDSSHVLVVVVAGGGEITHKVVDVADQFSADELHEAANYLNSEFTGLTLAEVRDAVVARMQEARHIYDALMARALHLASSGLQDMVPENSLFVQGTSLLVDEFAAEAARAREEEVRVLETLRTLFRMIEEKHRLIRLLSTYLDLPGLTIVIGSEIGARELEPFSVVASTYDAGGRTGAIGVIGPTRMRYSRAINLVDAVARAITVKNDHA